MHYAVIPAKAESRNAFTARDSMMSIYFIPVPTFFLKKEGVSQRSPEWREDMSDLTAYPKGVDYRDNPVKNAWLVGLTEPLENRKMLAILSIGRQGE